MPGLGISGIAHWALKTADLERSLRFYRDTLGFPEMAVDGNAQAWIADPDGNRIEFMHMLPGNLQEAAIARLRTTPPAPISAPGA